MHTHMHTHTHLHVRTPDLLSFRGPGVPTVRGPLRDRGTAALKSALNNFRAPTGDHFQKKMPDKSRKDIGLFY